METHSPSAEVTTAQGQLNVATQASRSDSEGSRFFGGKLEILIFKRTCDFHILEVLAN